MVVIHVWGDRNQRIRMISAFRRCVRYALEAREVAVDRGFSCVWELTADREVKR